MMYVRSTQRLMSHSSGLLLLEVTEWLEIKPESDLIESASVKYGNSKIRLIFVGKGEQLVRGVRDQTTKG